MRQFARLSATAFSILAMLTLTGALGGTGPVGAASECTFSADIDVTPGLSAMPNTGSFTTNGPSGSFSCGGAGGTVGFSGVYGTKDPDSCGGAFTGGNEGDGAFTISVPGPGTVADAFTFVYGTFSTSGGLVEGTFESERFSGRFQLLPTAGDCFSSPVTKARITGQGTLS